MAPGERYEPSIFRKRCPSEGEGSMENLNNHEPKTNRRAYECRICKQSFQKPAALGGHMNRHRSDRERETPHEAPVALVQETQQHQVTLSHSWNVQTGLCHFKMTGLGSLPILNWRMETKFSSSNLMEEFKVSIVYKEQEQHNAHRNQDDNVNVNAPRGFSPVVTKKSTGNSFHDGGSAK